MSNPVKDLRKQLRNIVQEILPSFLTHEVGMEMSNKLLKALNEAVAQRMDVIEKDIKSQLEVIAKRQKELSETLKAKIEELSKPSDEAK